MVDIYLGIGSNIEPTANIAQTMALLQEKYPSIVFSRIFKSVSVGFKGDDFLNLVAKFNSSDINNTGSDNGVQSLLVELKNVERQLGRKQADKKFSARRIDIDILLFGDLVCQQPIELPRDEILKNAYVLWPLSEIAAELIHKSDNPALQMSYQQHWQRFDQSKQKITPLKPT